MVPAHSLKVPMLTVRKSSERGYADHGWIRSHHSFSFGSYFDREHMGFGPLRVINEDYIAGGAGFPTHPHEDMEILTWVVDGALQHRDSMGENAVLGPGEMQHISAGTGITHSEFNASASDPVHLLQIWIKPEQRGLAPLYQQQAFPAAGRQDRLQLLAAPERIDGALPIRQKAWVYASELTPGTRVEHAPGNGHGAWVQLIRGAIDINGTRLDEGDASAVVDETKLTLTSVRETPAHLLLFHFSM